MRDKLTIFFATLVILISGTAYANDINPVIGKTNYFIIRETDLDRIISTQPVGIQQALRNDLEQRFSFVKQILLTKATAEKARKDGFDKNPDVKEAISNIIDQYIAQEYINKIVINDININESEIQKYHTEHEKDFQTPESVKIRHIFISLPKDSSADLQEQARSKAEDILDQVRKGVDFASIAKEQSEDTDSSYKGGELGYITAGKTNSPDFEKAALALRVGETSNLVKTPFGYHILKADDRKEKRTATLEETKDYINNLLKEQIKQSRVQKFLENLARDSGLEVAGEKPGGVQQ